MLRSIPILGPWSKTNSSNGQQGATTAGVLTDAGCGIGSRDDSDTRVPFDEEAFIVPPAELLAHDPVGC